MNKVSIKAPHGIGGSASIDIDGEQVKGATSVKFDLKADGFAVVEVGLLVGSIDFDGEAVTRIDAETAELLTKLGWTAPGK